MKSILILAILITASLRLNAITIDIEGSPIQPYGTAFMINEYFEKGFHLRPSGPIDTTSPYRLGRSGGGISFAPDNGGSFLQLLVGSSFVMTAVDNSLFNMIGVDVAEYSTVYAVPTRSGWRGYYPDGSYVDTTFVTDGFIDGVLPGKDFETFYFPSSFSGIVRLEATTILFSFDNLQVTAVPEPKTLYFMLFGLTVVYGLRLRRKIRNTKACS